MSSTMPSRATIALDAAAPDAAGKHAVHAAASSRDEGVGLILIGSSGHSGSTLLDLMLGSHPLICSAGEMNRLTLFAEDRVCTCGATVTQCGYWQRVLARIEETTERRNLRWSDCLTDVLPAAPIAQVEDGPDVALEDGGSLPPRLSRQFSARGISLSPSARLRFGGVRDAKWRVVDESRDKSFVLRRAEGRISLYPSAPTWKNTLRVVPSLLELAVAFGGQRSVQWATRLSPAARALLRTAENSWQVAEAMAAIEGTQWVVDSSKTSVRLKLLYLLRPARVRLIYLVRDGRAVVASAMRRQGVTAATAARVWKRENDNLALLFRGVPGRQLCRVRYEDLAEQPDAELARVCAFLGLRFEPAMLRLWERPVHNIPGNPMLFQKLQREVRRDDRWRRELSASDVAAIERIAGSLNRSLGYV